MQAGSELPGGTSTPCQESYSDRTPKLSQARILLVEDNYMNRDMLSRRLQKRGFDVVLAENAAEALTAARTAQPHLILMDIGLPDLDGWEVTRRLKGDPETQKIPVIALTAHALPADRARAFEAGCDDATPGSCGGVVMVDFDREAGSLGDAIGSAVKDVQRAGFDVSRVEVESSDG